MIRPIEFFPTSNALPFKLGVEYDGRNYLTPEEFHAVLAKFYRCDQCGAVLIFDADPPLNCPVCS